MTTLKDAFNAPIISPYQRLVDIGQIEPERLKLLRKWVRKGAMRTWRGYWDTGSDLFGMGPLKTWYGLQNPWLLWG